MNFHNFGNAAMMAHAAVPGGACFQSPGITLHCPISSLCDKPKALCHDQKFLSEDKTLEDAETTCDEASPCQSVDSLEGSWSLSFNGEPWSGQEVESISSEGNRCAMFTVKDATSGSACTAPCPKLHQRGVFDKQLSPEDAVWIRHDLVKEINEDCLKFTLRTISEEHEYPSRVEQQQRPDAAAARFDGSSTSRSAAAGGQRREEETGGGQICAALRWLLDNMTRLNTQHLNTVPAGF